MSITYAQKQVPAQKKEAPGADSIHDSSLQGEALQRKADLVSGIVQRIETPHPNNTGMPDNLKSGIESLSGYSMDNVRVHYNSSKPATVQALAYTQGTDIHVAPGQEKHLPHEAWHVAQQMAGRVAPTTNINGMPVNDNAALEHEADVMGEKAVTQRKEACGLNEASIGEGVCQRTEIHYTPMTISYIPTDTATDETYMSTDSDTDETHMSTDGDTDETEPVSKTEIVGHSTKATLIPSQPIKGTEPGDRVQEDLMAAIKPANGYRTNPFIRGHLLNSHLGGLGIAQNMVPITNNANVLHEKFVEQGVKNLVYANQIKKNHAQDPLSDTKENVRKKFNVTVEALTLVKKFKTYLKNCKKTPPKDPRSFLTTSTQYLWSIAPLISIKQLDVINQNITTQNIDGLIHIHEDLQEIIETKQEELRPLVSAYYLTDELNKSLPVQYDVQADILSNQPVSKKKPPETLLSCSVRYGSRPTSWTATIHSGPGPNQARIDGNITHEINEFLYSPSQQDLSQQDLEYLNFLHIEKGELIDIGWGNAQHRTNSGNLTDNKGDDLQGTGIIDWDEKTDDVRVNGKKILPIPNPINTFYHTSTGQTINREVNLFQAMRAIDDIKESVKNRLSTDYKSSQDSAINTIKANAQKHKDTIANMLLPKQ